MTQEEFDEMVNEEYRPGTVIVNLSALILLVALPIVLLLVH